MRVILGSLPLRTQKIPGPAFGKGWSHFQNFVFWWPQESSQVKSSPSSIPGLRWNTTPQPTQDLGNGWKMKSQAAHNKLQVMWCHLDVWWIGNPTNFHGCPTTGNLQYKIWWLDNLARLQEAPWSCLKNGSTTYLSARL